MYGAPNLALEEEGDKYADGFKSELDLALVVAARVALRAATVRASIESSEDGSLPLTALYRSILHLDVAKAH